MEDILISDLAQACVDQLQGVSTIVLDADILEAFEEQAGRFNVWAGNLGVFARAHGSLDYRLRDSPLAKNLAVEQLEGLQDSLERATRVINEHDDTNEEEAFDELQYDQYGLRYSSASSSFATSSITTMSKTGSTVETPFKTLLLSSATEIEQIVSRLYRLSMFIRKPSKLNRNPRADAFIMRDEEGNDAGPAFKLYIVELLLRRYPDLPDYLRERLSNAVVSRRKRFIWRQKHQQKLDPKGLADSPDGNRTKGVPTVPHAIAPTQASPTPVISGKDSKFKHSKSAQYSVTTATQMSKNKIGYGLDTYATSTTSTAYHAESASPVTVPPLPRLPSGRTEFLCPYCCMVLLSKEAEPRRWQQHVLHDIEPYVCLLQGCTEEEEVYRLPGSWLNHHHSHHQQSHLMQWICTNPGHGPKTFNSEFQYEAHLRESHLGAFSELQIPSLKKMSQRRSVSPFTSCPFCGIQLGGDENAKIASVQTPEAMIDHIRYHLQGIALLSLPWLDNYDDTSSVKTVSQKKSMASSEDNLFEVSLEFADTSIDVRPGDNDKSVSSTTTHESNSESGWSFLPETLYNGHERDPILQPFLRNLYLGLSPNMNTVRGPVLPCYFMPRTPNKTPVIRRKVLDILANSLLPNPTPQTSDEPKPRTHALCGPGGMGKTSTASQFARQYRDQFDVVLWIHADSQAKLLQDFRDIAVKLGLVAEDSVDANDQMLTRNLLKSWLIKPRKPTGAGNGDSAEEASWLVVFDGVGDAEVLNDAWPYDGPGSILITSRDPLSFDAFSGVIKLGPLDNDDAVQFLLCYTGKENDRSEAEDAEAVVKRIGGIPLILAQMAGMIVQQRWSMSDFLLAYGKRESLDELSPMAVHKNVLASVWALESLKYGRCLLNVLSMLDPDGVPEHLLTAHMLHARQQGYPRNAYEYHRAKHELLSSSLISEDKETRQLWLHRMCQDVAKRQMDSATYRSTFLECVQLISAAWPYELFTWRHGIERWAKCATLFPHVVWLLGSAGPVNIGGDNLDLDYEFAKLLTDAGWYHHERGHSVESVRFSDMALTVLKPLLARCSEMENQDQVSLVPHKEAIEATIAEIFHNQGCFATETNQPVEALEYHNIFHNMMLAKIGPAEAQEDMRLAISWNELGNAYMLNRAWDQGKACFKRSIADMRLLKGFDKLQLSLPFVNLGLAYWVTGKLEKASKILTEALADREEVFGADDSNSFITGRILHALGNVKLSQNMHDDSFSYHRRALLQYTSTLGKNHHRTADLCVKVATHHLRLRHWELARALLMQALKIYDNRAVFLPERVRVMFNQWKVYRALGKGKKADASEIEFMEGYRQLAPSDQRPVIELDDQILDDLIVFWSR